tara:strand:+ start:283 stop:816 length:534 start_codon:yes stop_codon:yes gene_type:complete
MIGRTANAIKIKIKDGLRAVNCACCSTCKQVQPLDFANTLTSQQYSDIFESTTFSYDVQMTYDSITKGDTKTTSLLPGCSNFVEPYPEYPLGIFYIYVASILGILEGQKYLNFFFLFFAEYDGIGGITISAGTGEYPPLYPVGILEVKIKGVTAFTLQLGNDSPYEGVTATGYCNFQ